MAEYNKAATTDLSTQDHRSREAGDDADISSDTGEPVDKDAKETSPPSSTYRVTEPATLSQNPNLKDVESGAAERTGPPNGKEDDGLAVSGSESIIVGWDGEDDPANPYN